MTSASSFFSNSSYSSSCEPGAAVQAEIILSPPRKRSGRPPSGRRTSPPSSSVKMQEIFLNQSFPRCSKNLFDPLSSDPSSSSGRLAQLQHLTPAKSPLTNGLLVAPAINILSATPTGSTPPPSAIQSSSPKSGRHLFTTPPSSPKKATSSCFVFESPLKRKSSGIQAPKEKKRMRFTPVAALPEGPSKASPTPLIEQQIELIDKWIDKKQIDGHEKIALKERIVLICASSLNEEEKLAELGVLYFYLTKYDTALKLPSEGCLEARYQEIAIELEELTTIHGANCEQSSLALHPSGKVAYLMRAFARMIFTPDGEFNPGGCESVKLLLNTSINDGITEEIRTQILTIIDRLLQDSVFCKRFFYRHSYVHPKAAELIRIDLLLRQDEPIEALHIRWAKLIGLFSVIGQLDEGNCFGVSTTFNLFRQEPDFVLAFFESIIETGSFEYKGTKIPLSIVDGRKTYKKDFNEKHLASKAAQLTAFSVVQNSLGISISTSSGEVTLEHLFNTNFPDRAEEAKQRFLSLKRNMFQQSFLAYMQFIAINAPDSLTAVSTVSTKEKLMRMVNFFIYKRYLAQFPLHSADAKVFLQSFQKELASRLWFVDYRNDSSKVNEGRVCFPHHSTGLLLGSKQPSEFDPFLNMRRLCYLKDGELIPVDSLSNLKGCFSEIAEEALKEMPQPEKWREVVNEFQDFLNQKIFKIQAAKMLPKLNPRINFSWKIFYRSDAFMIAQNGSFTSLIMGWEHVQKTIAPKSLELSADSPSSWFTAICGIFRTHLQKNPAFLSGHNPTALIRKPGHAFNLYPRQFEDFFLHDTDDRLFNTISMFAMEIQKKKPTLLLLKRILTDALGAKSIIADKVLKSMPKRFPVNMKNFRQVVLKLLPQDKHADFDRSFNKILTEVSFNDFKSQLPALLQKHKIDAQDSLVSDLIKWIDDHLPEDKRHCSILELATLTKQALLEHGQPFLSVYALECTLANLCRIPMVVKLGNLNWIGDLEEAPIYADFCLKYDLAEGCYIFCKRKSTTENPLSEEFVSNLLIDTTVYLTGN